MQQVMRDVSDIIDQYTGYSRSVLDYSQIIKGLIDATKDPNFSAVQWDALAELVNVASFQRIGNFREEMNWQEYLAFLSDWAPNADWNCAFKRITEQGNTVFLELEERSEMTGFSSTVNSLSVYEFDASGKIHHIDVYLQMDFPSKETLGIYENVELSS